MSKKNIRLQSLFTLSEIISPSSDGERIKQAMLSNSIEWLSVVEIANAHFLTASLYYSLLEKGLLEFINDDELLSYLKQIYSINLKRNQKIIEQSKEIAQILLKKDIKPIFLKGVASLLENNYNDVGMRFLSDIDFCVFKNDFSRAKKQLLASGYIPKMNDGINIEKHHHWWPMFHPNWTTIVEIHKFILTFPYSHLIDCSENTCERSTYHNEITILSPTYRLIHTYIHSDVVDRSYALKKMDLRQLYEMSMIIDDYKSQINWSYIEDFFKTHKMWDKFNYKLCLINELYKVHSPILTQNTKFKLHFTILSIFFKYQNTFLINNYINFQNIRYALSYRNIRMRYGASTKKEYIQYTFNYVFNKLKDFSFREKKSR